MTENNGASTLILTSAWFRNIVTGTAVAGALTYVIHTSVAGMAEARIKQNEALISTVQTMLGEQARSRLEALEGIRALVGDRTNEQRELARTLHMANKETLFKVDGVAAKVAELQVLLARQESLGVALEALRVENKRLADKLDEIWRRLREAVEHIKGMENFNKFEFKPWRE